MKTPPWHRLVLIFCHFFVIEMQTSGATRHDRLHRKQYWECTGQCAGGNLAIRKGKLLKESETSTLASITGLYCCRILLTLCRPFRHDLAQQGARIIWPWTIYLFQEANSFQRVKLKDKLRTLKNRLQCPRTNMRALLLKYVATFHETCRVPERCCISLVQGGKQRPQGLMIKWWDIVLRANQVHKCARTGFQSRRETWGETNTKLWWSAWSLREFLG